MADPSRKMVKQWFKYAAADLAMAKKTLSFNTEYKNIAGFHAQQCAEKAAKGFLAYHKIRFSKTHDLAKLAEEINQVDEKLARLVKKSEKMNDLAVAYRYPDAQKKPLTVAKIRSAIKQAEVIYIECFNRVRAEAGPGLFAEARTTKK